MAYTYAHLYGFQLRWCFFTVYGPGGIIDMAPMLFADAIYKVTTKYLTMETLSRL